ncbi:MAG: hypothetical protein M1820_000069 [Bogoriella megaspora]|nr:MAG: hypothetical protein M1820_000069 [Bogoriella megaspora]
MLYPAIGCVLKPATSIFLGRLSSQLRCAFSRPSIPPIHAVRHVAASRACYSTVEHTVSQGTIEPPQTIHDGTPANEGSQLPSAQVQKGTKQKKLKKAAKRPQTADDTQDAEHILKKSENELAKSMEDISRLETSQTKPAQRMSRMKKLRRMRRQLSVKRSSRHALRKTRSSLRIRYFMSRAAVSSPASKPGIQGKTLKEAMLGPSTTDAPPKLILKSSVKHTAVEKITASELSMKSVENQVAPVPSFAHGLDRVLFNPGVYHLQDPRSRVFNFDPYLQMIMPIAEFDFNALKRYVTSSQDETLSALAESEGCKYVGSTSSMTAVLSQFHFLLSQWRELNLSMLSKGFPSKLTSFTQLSRAPAAIALRWKNGTYAIDADKEFDTPNVLSMLGRSLEKLMVLPKEDYERYRKSDPRVVSEEEREAEESHHYSSMGDFLLRSQLDAHDSRLPGSGMVDIKTRAVISIRMSSSDHERGLGYQLRYAQGQWESFEREYYDMMRSTMLKYSLQARMGRMDGIFAAYHNVERIFGFQYVSLPDMDLAIHGQHDTLLGDQEYKISVHLLNQVLNKATKEFPNTSLRLHFETREASVNFMYIFVEPVEEAEIEEIQRASKDRIEQYEQSVLGLLSKDELNKRENQKDWESIIEQVKDEVRDDEFDSKGPSGPDAAGPAVAQPETEPTTGNQVDTRKSSSRNDNDERNVEAKEDANGGQKTSRAESRSGKPDVETTSKVAPEGIQMAKPLLGMTLTTRTLINGTYRVRPEHLRPEDKWQMEYSLAEISSSEKVRSLYESCKRRRKAQLGPEEKDDAGNDYFLNLIQEYTNKGKEWRAMMDELESRRETIVFEEGASGAGTKDGAVSENDGNSVQNNRVDMDDGLEFIEGKS